MRLLRLAYRSVTLSLGVSIIGSVMAEPGIQYVWGAVGAIALTLFVMSLEWER